MILILQWEQFFDAAKKYGYSIEGYDEGTTKETNNG